MSRGRGNRFEDKAGRVCVVQVRWVTEVSGMNHMKSVRSWIFSLFLLSVLVSCRLGGDKVYRESDFLLDTVVTVSVVSGSAERAGQAIEKVFRELKRLGGLLNFYSSKSEIREINENAGVKPVRVSGDTLRVIQRSIEAAEETNGAFDITVGVITHLYDFHKKIHPSADAVRAGLALVDYRDIEVDPGRMTVFLRKKGMMIDPGGITKGYAADRAVSILKKEGISAALVAVAGDIRGYGLKPDGKPWRVGIRNPRGAGDDIFAVVELRDQAISTSGDYERFFIEGGVRYHHLIDPKTGYPARGVISTTVIAPLAVKTDSLATAVFISGVARGMKIIEGLGYNAIMIDSGGVRHLTEGIRGRVEFIKKDN